MVVRSGGWSSQLLQETTVQTGVLEDRLAAAVARAVPPSHRCRRLNDRISDEMPQSFFFLGNQL